MGRSPMLECFDTGDVPAISETNAAPNRDWQDGYAIGLSEEQALAVAAQEALTADIAQSFADMAFGYAEARAHVLHGLKPLFGALINRVLPQMTEVAIASHLTGLLNDAAAQDSALPVELSVHPKRIEALTALLPYAVGLPVMLVADPAIGLDQAVLRSGRAETALDIGAIIAGAQTALGAIFESIDERVTYG